MPGPGRLLGGVAAPAGIPAGWPTAQEWPTSRYILADVGAGGSTWPCAPRCPNGGPQSQKARHGRSRAGGRVGVCSYLLIR